METLNRLLNDLVAYFEGTRSSTGYVFWKNGFTFCQLGIPPFKKKKIKIKIPFKPCHFLAKIYVILYTQY